MHAAENINGNSQISALIQRAGPKIVKAVQQASAKTGVNFAYLMEKASVESSFRPDVKNKSSSASGLYQFIEKTWLSMVKKYGDKYGMGQYADKIDDSGRCRDPGLRRKILSLRNDPEKAACMAAEYAAENGRYLSEHTGTDIGSVELYLAHFMGPSGASQFLNAMDSNASRPAARLFPEAAAANENVFYDQATGKARSLQDVYDFFAQKFDGSTSALADPSQAGDSSALVADAGNVIHMQDIIWNDTRENALRRLSGGGTDDAAGEMVTAQRGPIPLMSTRGAFTVGADQLLMLASLDVT